MPKRVPFISEALTDLPETGTGFRIQGTDRMNWISFLKNDGPGNVILSFDEPHPVADNREIVLASGEKFQNIPIAGGFESVFVRADQPSTNIRFLAFYRSDLPDRKEEITDREGVLETLRDIRHELKRIREGW